eukprot:2077198-Rhodomonas_salina.4
MVYSSQGHWYAIPPTVPSLCLRVAGMQIQCPSSFLHSSLWVAGTTLPLCIVPHLCLRVAGARPLSRVPACILGSLASLSLTPLGHWCTTPLTVPHSFLRVACARQVTHCA